MKQIKKDQIKLMNKKVKGWVKALKILIIIISVLACLGMFAVLVAYLILSSNEDISKINEIEKNFLIVWNKIIIVLAGIQAPITIFTIIRNLDYFTNKVLAIRKQATADLTEFKSLVSKTLNNGKKNFNPNEPIFGFIEGKQLLYVALPANFESTDKTVILNNLAIVCNNRAQSIKLNYNANDFEFKEIERSLVNKKISADYKSKAIVMKLDNYKELLNYPQALIKCLRLMSEEAIYLKGGEYFE